MREIFSCFANPEGGRRGTWLINVYFPLTYIRQAVLIEARQKGVPKVVDYATTCSSAGSARWSAAQLTFPFVASDEKGLGIEVEPTPPTRVKGAHTVSNTDGTTNGPVDNAAGLI